MINKIIKSLDKLLPLYTKFISFFLSSISLQFFLSTARIDIKTCEIIIKCIKKIQSKTFNYIFLDKKRINKNLFFKLYLPISQDSSIFNVPPADVRLLPTPLATSDQLLLNKSTTAVTGCVKAV